MNESTDNLMSEIEQAINDVQVSTLDLAPEITPLSRNNIIFWYENYGLRMELLEIIQDSRTRSPSAEVIVQVSKKHYPNIRNETIYRTRLNLISIQSKTKFVNEMKRKIPPIEWADVVENITEETLLRYREGNEVMKIGSIQDEGMPSYQAFPIIRSDGVNILFGQGAQGKSYISTFICMLVQSGMDHAGIVTEQGNVLYLDWEDSWQSVNRRVMALKKGNNDTLHDIDHVDMSGTTIDTEMSSIIRMVEDRDISLVVIDSFGMAVGGNQNEGDYVKGVMSSLNELKASVLVIDHVSKENGDTPIGSNYKQTSARNVWKIDKSQNLGANIVEVGLYHTKANNSKLFAPVGLRLEFINDMYDQTDRVLISPIDVENSDALADQLPVAKKIEKALTEAPMTVEQLITYTGSSINTVRTTLSRNNYKFERIERNTYRLKPKYYGGNNA